LDTISLASIPIGMTPSTPKSLANTSAASPLEKKKL
jgi:hypothetical protein